MAIAEGAHFRGSIDMQRGGDKPGAPKPGAPAGDVKTENKAGQPQPVGAAPAKAVDGRRRRLPSSAPAPKSVRARADSARRLFPSTPPPCSAFADVRPRDGARAEVRRCETVSQGTSRALTDLFARWGTRRSEDAARPHEKTVTTTATNEKTLWTKAFGKFLVGARRIASRRCCSTSARSSATTSTFSANASAARSSVEDVYANIEKHCAADRTSELAEYLKTRFPQADASFDGILCWDVFDYLDKSVGADRRAADDAPAQAGRRGAGRSSPRCRCRRRNTRAILVVNDKNLRHRAYPASRGRQQVFVNRDITRMFEGLTVSESFLLMTKMREMVFRKPESKASAAS